MLTGARATVRILVFTFAAASMSGCNVFGPASIATGRAVYNEVINKTEDEELLNIIVRERYDDTYGMLAVSSVTANIRASAKAGAEVGVGKQHFSLVRTLIGMRLYSPVGQQSKPVLTIPVG